MFQNWVTLIRGAGDIATGVAWRMKQCGFPIIMTEIEEPLAIRLSVSFANCIYQKTTCVENVIAKRVETVQEALALHRTDQIPVLIDPQMCALTEIGPQILIDSIIAKRNTGVQKDHASLVIGIGPGFCTENDVDAVIETQRGHRLGRVIHHGTAAKDTKIPGEVGGETIRRVLKAPCSGTFHAQRAIGDYVATDDLLATVDESPIYAQISGFIRGMLHTGLSVEKNLKVADIDPRAEQHHCFTISDKSLAVAGGVLEACLHFIHQAHLTQNRS